jgi:MOSC domain-containing protein
LITLSGLFIYPVKGLKGIALDEARCTDRGLENDRRFMVVDADNVFISQRSHPKMATVWTEIAGDTLALSAPDMPELAVPLRPADGKQLRVTVWSSACEATGVTAEADRWLSEYLGFGCRLVYMPDDSKRYSNPQYAGQGKRVGFADGYAYLLASEGSLADLNARLGTRGHPPLPMNRFRPNLVVSGGAAFAEDRWSEIRVGGAVLQAAKPCGRCEVTTTDQASGERLGPEPLATLATFRDSREFGLMFGMNLVTAQGGVVRLGEAVHVN